jgi:perosamine synthetase
MSERSVGADSPLESKTQARLFTYGRQYLDDHDKQAVLRALESDWLTQGPEVKRFEDALCQRFGAKRAVVCSSGTAALHLAALGFGWQPGDVVLVPAMTFVASANCAVYVGAEPYFVDITPDTLTLDPSETERAVVRLRHAGRRVRAIVAVDFAGHPADWTALRAIADRYELQLLDDACHALGATYGGIEVGACADADSAAFSFHPVKHITTCEGGAILTNDDRLANHAEKMRSHGIVRGQGSVPDWEGPWHLEMTALGYNYRLTDVQSALGTSQLGKLNLFLAKRREIAGWYDELLADDALFRRPAIRENCVHSYHLYVLRTHFADGAASRRRFFKQCLEKGIQLQVHYRPIPLNSFYRDRVPQGTIERLPASMHYYRECFSVPMYPQLTRDDVSYVVDVIRAAARAG